MTNQTELTLVKKPTFKQGGCVILREIEESAVEYDYDVSYKVDVYVKSETALKRLQRLFWHTSARRSNQYGALYQATLTLEGRDYRKLCDTFGTAHLCQAVEVSYENHYADHAWWTTVSVPSFEFATGDGKYELSGDEYMGSCADGYPFSELLDGLKNHPIVQA